MERIVDVPREMKMRHEAQVIRAHSPAEDRSSPWMSVRRSIPARMNADDSGSRGLKPAKD
jgi:hypothetical protein